MKKEEIQAKLDARIGTDEALICPFSFSLCYAESANECLACEEFPKELLEEEN